jgi:8-amino-7-oxononanoate synthase
MNEWWRVALQERENAHLLRRLNTVPPETLDLASNDYLGLAKHPEVLDAACAAVREFGAGARASRLVSGHTELHWELESALAEFKNCEAALLFPSGYHANLAAVTSLARAGDLICCDKRNHASLIDACLLASARGAKVRFYDSLAKLRALLERSTAEARLIVSDAVYSMDGDLAPLAQLIELAQEFDAMTILDDAHGTGTLGATGRGALEELNFGHTTNIIQVGTLSKALGAQGGFVCGSRVLIEWLINAARPFIYTTALNPASCGAALQSLKIIEREPERISRLRQVKTRLARGLSTLGFDAREQPSPIIPVIVGEAQHAVELSEKLLARNIWCPAIRPPTVPKNASRLRVTASSELGDDDLKRVLAAFVQCR